MNLPETLRIELVAQFAQRRADKRFAFRGEDAGVLVVGLEIADVLHGDQPHLIAHRSADPRQPLGGVAAGAGESGQSRQQAGQRIERALELRRG